MPLLQSKMEIQIERWLIERLIPRANNPRTHSREQVANISADEGVAGANDISGICAIGTNAIISGLVYDRPLNAAGPEEIR